ncbi:Predicted membrane protein [Bordetella ansorpii]|uniref:Predicted membrane protein n=1 Tax=Bordetella ansorpii TaxID=288768 RepID=A0A157SPV5_9BORD|nr:TadG family pilus assembly protein [Bordetella ansorpii]SAI72442.1 Predicted membrane protein [Bordetella ansorpii]
MPHMRFPRLPRRQRGSILIPAAMAILLGMVLLWGVQLGYAFYLKRELQKTVDMAALTAAQVLAGGGATECAAAVTAARSAITANMRDVGTPQVACVRWDGKNAALAPRYIRSADIGAGERYNAVSINLSTTAPSLFPFTEGVTLYAEAVGARPAEPIAAFSVGTRLATAENGAVLTNLLRGVGLNIAGTALVGYDSGLANVKITPAGLLNQLGIDVPANISVADLNQLLAAQTRPLSALLDAAVTVAGHGELLAANVGLLNAIQTQLGVSNLQVQLGSNQDGRASSLFTKIVAPTAQAALNAEVNVLDLIGTAIGVGTGGHAIASTLSFDFLGISVRPQFSVIEPPSIAIGGVGATAYTAQVRLYVPIKVNTPSLLGGLINLNLDLPIVVDLVDGKGILQSLCQARDSSDRDLANIAVQSSILKVCVGGPPAGAGANWPFSTSASCDQGLTNKQMLQLGILGGVNLATLNTKLAVEALPANGSADFYVGQTRQIPATGNPLLIGDTLKNVTDALLSALLGSSLQGGQNLSGAQNTQLRNQLATKYWQDTAMQYPCNADGISSSAAACRGQRQQAALQAISASTSGLGGFLGGLTSNTLGLVGNLVTLNVAGLVGNVGGIVGGLLGTVGSTLTQVTEALGLGPCSSALTGSQAGCINTLSNTLAQNASAPAVGNPPNAVVALAGLVLGALQQPLNSIGTSIIKPVVENVIGLQVGQTDVKLMSLQCNGNEVQLVY